MLQHALECIAIRNEKMKNMLTYIYLQCRRHNNIAEESSLVVVLTAWDGWGSPIVKALQCKGCGPAGRFKTLNKHKPKILPSAGQALQGPYLILLLSPVAALMIPVQLHLICSFSTHLLEKSLCQRRTAQSTKRTWQRLLPHVLQKHAELAELVWWLITL